MNCFHKKKDCCVCYEPKDIIVQCKFCLEGTLCHECHKNISLYGQDKKCPCCRQNDWSNLIAKKTKVYPKIEERDVVEIDLESGLERPQKLCDSYMFWKSIKNTFHNILYIVKALWTVCCLWILGIFTMFMVGGITPEHDRNVLITTIIPIFVGLIEIILIMCCCCNNECRLGFLEAMCCQTKN